MSVRTGPLWHKIAGVATSRNVPRQRGGQPCLGQVGSVHVTAHYERSHSDVESHDENVGDGDPQVSVDVEQGHPHQALVVEPTLGPEWRPLIGPDSCKYSALIGATLLCQNNTIPIGRAKIIENIFNGNFPLKHKWSFCVFQCVVMAMIST